MKKVYLSEEKLKALQEELEELRTTTRRKIAEDLKYAKSLGDLSENAEYHEAREAQAILESRIRELDEIIKNAETVSSHHSEIVEIGTTVIISKKGDKTSERTYELVGSEEADTISGKISNESPLGEALMGKKRGEDFELDAPSGKVSYTIVDIK